MHKRCREIMDELILSGELEEITWFKFAPKQELKLRLKDILEDFVDEKYLLNQKLVSKYIETGTASKHKGSQAGKVANETDETFWTINAGTHGYSMGYVKLEQTHTLNIKGNDSIKRIYSSDGLCPSLTTMQGGHREPKVAIQIRWWFTKEQYAHYLAKNCDNKNEKREIYRQFTNFKVDKIAHPVREVDRRVDEKYLISRNQINTMSEYPKEKTFSNIKQLDGISSTITANPQRATIDNGNLIELDKYCNENDKTKYIFRKLTPRECFRLQGFDDSFIFPPKMSDTQLYKQAGNGMSRNILDMIFTQIFTCYAKHIEKQNER